MNSNFRKAVMAISLFALGCSGGGGSSSSPGTTTPVCQQSLPHPHRIASGVRPLQTTNCATADNPGGGTCANNQLPLVIGDTSATYYDINSPQTTIKVCVPGSTTQCAVIDSILIDTGSSGLRLFPNALTNAGLSPSAFPGVTVTGQAGSLYECEQFLSGYMFGPVVSADVYMGGTNYSGEMVSGVSMQIADPSGAQESACTTDTSNIITSCSGFNFNGIMGVGLAVADCGSFCASANNEADVYFDCTGGASGSCANIGIATGKQVTNPIAKLGTDNNGVIVSFPSGGLSGGVATAIAGTLTLGIDTETNNASTSATLYTVDQYGNFTTVYKGNTYGSAGTYSGGQPSTLAFIDSGSNGLFFTDTLTACGSNLEGFYCPASLTNLNGTVKGSNGASSTNVSFAIANEGTALSNGDYALGDLGGTLSPEVGFDWGLPFFYGRDVFVGFENRMAHSNTWTGPFWAF